MFNCCVKRKTKIIPKKRKDSYSDFYDVCVEDWEIKNKNLNLSQVAPKPPTPISTMNNYIKKKKNEKKNNKLNNK
jgi:hypothetical protein